MPHQPPVIVTSSRTLTAAEVNRRNVDCTGSNIIITLPTDMSLNGGTSAGSVTIRNKGSATQTVSYTGTGGRTKTKTIAPEFSHGFGFSGFKKVWGANSKPKPLLPEGAIGNIEAAEFIAETGSDDIPLITVGDTGTAEQQFKVIPTGRILYLNTQCTQSITEDETLDATVIDGVRPLYIFNGSVQNQVNIPVTSGAPFATTLDDTNGASPIITFSNADEDGPPPGVVVTITLPDPVGILPGTQFTITRPDELTSLFVIIDGGASFGGAANAARDRAEIPLGHAVWFLTVGVSGADGASTGWYTIGNPTLD